MKQNENKTDRELLIHLCEECAEAKTDRGWLKRMFSNHLAHHSKIEVGLLLVIVGAVITVVLSIIL